MILDDDQIVKEELDRKQKIFKYLNKTIYDYVCYRTSQEGYCDDVKFVLPDGCNNEVGDFAIDSRLNQLQEYNDTILKGISCETARKITNHKVANDFIEQLMLFIEQHNLDITEYELDYRISRYWFYK